MKATITVWKPFPHINDFLAEKNSLTKKEIARKYRFDSHGVIYTTEYFSNIDIPYEGDQFKSASNFLPQIMKGKNKVIEVKYESHEPNYYLIMSSNPLKGFKIKLSSHFVHKVEERIERQNKILARLDLSDLYQIFGQTACHGYDYDKVKAISETESIVSDYDSGITLYYYRGTGTMEVNLSYIGELTDTIVEKIKVLHKFTSKFNENQRV